MKILREELNFNDVLIKPKQTSLVSRSEPDLKRTMHFKHGDFVLRGIPIIAANMDGVGTISMARKLSDLGAYTALHKFYDEDRLIEHFSNGLYDMHTFYTTGVCESDLEKLDRVSSRIGKSPTLICLDVANGYMRRFLETVETVRKKYPKSVIMAGNVVDPEQSSQIRESGADIVKVGIGGGSACLTRMIAGVGRPQLSAVLDCAGTAFICSDGGCSTPADVAKAFVAGADFVMLGGMLAGTTESELEVVNGKVTFYGMSSSAAMKNHYGSMDPHRNSEGRIMQIDHKGPAEDQINWILNGIRSACTYTDSANINDLRHAQFYKSSVQLNNPFGGDNEKR